MDRKNKKKDTSKGVSAGRIIVGMIILYIAVLGGNNVLKVDRNHAVGIMVTVIGVPITILFFLLGLAMITAGLTQNKKRRKGSPEKLRVKKKQ